MCLQHCSPAHASLKGMAVPQDSCTQMGRRWWPPPGGVQSAAHRKCAVRARSPAKSSSAKCQDQSQMANLKGQAHSARLKSYTPLFFSPQEGWDDRNPVTKFAPSAFSGLLNRFFCSSWMCFKNDFEKTSKKLRKSWILASQNFPQIHPKCLQNRCFKKHAIFHGFLLIFGCLLQQPNLKFHAPTQCFVSFSQKSGVRFWHAFLVQKAHQKPFQDETRTL